MRLEKSQVPFDSRYWLDTYQPNNIISLGSLSSQPKDTIDSNIPWVLSAVHKQPINAERLPDTTVSLIPEPSVLFNKVLNLLPDS